MTTKDFCYWLQGFIEVGDPKTITEGQLKVIKEHLSLVFRHEVKSPTNTISIDDLPDAMGKRPTLPPIVPLRDEKMYCQAADVS